jgi:hypothetical protein
MRIGSSASWLSTRTAIVVHFVVVIFHDFPNL